MPEMCFQEPEPIKRRRRNCENANTGRKTPVIVWRFAHFLLPILAEKNASIGRKMPEGCSCDGTFIHLNNKFNSFSAKMILGRKHKTFLGNLIATLVFMLQRKILSRFFFFSQRIELFRWTMKKNRKSSSIWTLRTQTLNPQAPGEGEISLPHSRAIFSKLKNEDKDLFSFRNCKKWCKKAQSAIISLSFPSYVNWQPPENRRFIGERARREVARRGFGSPQAVVYEWIRLSFVLPYADHLFSMTQALLPHFCSNEAWEMVMCL